MENLLIDGTDDTPRFNGDFEKGFTISGISMMENPLVFYKPIHDWVTEFNDSSVSQVTINMDLKYINSSSTKQLLRLLMSVDESEKESKLLWYYPSGNDFLKERGEEFEIMLDIPFEYIEKKV